MNAQLTFNIRAQTISRADRFIIVSGSVNYLWARFCFLTPDWEGLAKVAIFSRKGVESAQVYIGTEGLALVPWTMLEDPGEFEVTVYGVGGSSTAPVLETATKAVCKVVEGAYTGDAVEHDPVPDLWKQLIIASKNMDGGTYKDWEGGSESPDEPAEPLVDGGQYTDWSEGYPASTVDGGNYKDYEGDS